VDFSDADLHEQLAHEPFSVAVNEAIERATATTNQNARGYLGASSAGSECARRIQFDWMCAPTTDARKSLIFGRGHAAEAMMRALLERAGFTFAPVESLAFVALEHFSGHADGVIVGKPALPGAWLPIPALWECKCVKQDYWNRVARDGLVKTFPQYATQVALYQHFLDKRNPALFTVVNANDCRALHFPVPYDQARAEVAIERVKQVIEATKAGELLPRAYRNPDQWQCKRSCGHVERCWRQP
jgi:hypothetical protein